MNDNLEIYITVILATLVLVLMLTGLVLLMMAQRNRRLRHQMEISQVREAYQQEILKTQLEIREQTLKNIADEIHDNIGQVLSLINIQLSWLDLGNEEETAGQVKHMSVLLAKVITDLRDLSKTLDPQYIARNGLAACVRRELELIEKTGLFKTSFILSGKETRADPSQEIVIHRIIQEALNNAIKHSEAKELKVELAYTPAQLTVQIADNGKGLAADMDSLHGSGLHNMRSRSGLINAAFSIDSAPMQGTRIRIQLPLNS
jgi:signal transduction histidine kinase